MARLFAVRLWCWFKMSNSWKNAKKMGLTRMHSSRIRTGRSLLPGGGVSAPRAVCFRGGVCSQAGCLLPGGCLLWGWGVCSGGGVSTPGGGVSASRGVSVPGWGVSAPGGVSALGDLLWGGLLLGGVCSQGGCLLPGKVWYPSMHWGRHPPLWTEWQTGVKILPWPQLRCGR